MHIEDFTEFVGLKYGDSAEKIVDIFGKPHDIYYNDQNTYRIYYYNYMGEDVLSISFNKDQKVVESIYLGQRRISSVIDMLESKKIDDSKVGFMDKHIDDIIDHFGVPDEEHGDTYTFKTPKLEVEFICPEENDYFCQRINVIWFYKK